MRPCFPSLFPRCGSRRLAPEAPHRQSIIRPTALRQSWTFAVSGNSRNCGDFVVPAIAAKVKAEKDAFYWHLGDFRLMSKGEDLQSMQPAGKKAPRTSIPIASGMTS